MDRTVKLVAALAVPVLIGTAFACSLNPQPLPPDSPEFVDPENDRAGGNGTTAPSVQDAAVPPAPADAAGDAMPYNGADASTDGPLDAPKDATTD